MCRLEVRNVPPEAVRAILVDELAGIAAGDETEGNGWLVRLVRGEPAYVGRYRVPVLFIEVEGERSAEIAHFLRLKMMRGGG